MNGVHNLTDVDQTIPFMQTNIQYFLLHFTYQSFLSVMQFYIKIRFNINIFCNAKLLNYQLSKYFKYLKIRLLKLLINSSNKKCIFSHFTNVDLKISDV
jgi:hypothetical protein